MGIFSQYIDISWGGGGGYKLVPKHILALGEGVIKPKYLSVKKLSLKKKKLIDYGAINKRHNFSKLGCTNKIEFVLILKAHVSKF